MTATQTPCATPRTSGRTLDPPLAHPARKRYWEDTVFEAVGELRHRLSSSREEMVTLALLTIIDVEKTRMRHGRPVSGTQASHARDDDGSLPKLGPLEVDQPPEPKRREGEAPAEPPGCSHRPSVRTGRASTGHPRAARRPGRDSARPVSRCGTFAPAYIDCT